jgi:hypothetical protein
VFSKKKKKLFFFNFSFPIKKNDRMCSFVESEKKYIKVITIIFIKNKTIIYNSHLSIFIEYDFYHSN